MASRSPEVESQVLFAEERVSLQSLEQMLSHRPALFAPRSCVLLEGELGAGKTTFIRLLLQAMGCTEPVSSPSYVLCHEYQTESGTVEHWDLYRLPACPSELLEPQGSSVLRLIEWGNKFNELQELFTHRVKLDLIDDAFRSVFIEAL